MVATRTIVLNSGGGNDQPPWVGLGDGLFPPHDEYEVASLEDAGLVDFAHGASAMHDFGRALAGNIRVFAEPAGDFASTFGNGLSIDRWSEVAELLRSVGETGELVASALREAHGLLATRLGALESRTAPLVGAFVVEGAAQFLMGLGHTLCNVALRLAIENNACAKRLNSNASKGIRKAMSAAKPGAAAPGAWLFHSQAGAIADALGRSRTGPAAFTRTVARLEKSRDWDRMSAVRNSYFHRYRYGFAAGDESAIAKAKAFLSATESAAACLGRAFPSLFYSLLDSMPRARKSGKPLMGMIQVQKFSAKNGSPGPLLPILAKSPFYR